MQSGELIIASCQLKPTSCIIRLVCHHPVSSSAYAVCHKEQPPGSEAVTDLPPAGMFDKDHAWRTDICLKPMKLPDLRSTRDLTIWEIFCRDLVDQSLRLVELSAVRRRRSRQAYAKAQPLSQFQDMNSWGYPATH